MTGRIIKLEAKIASSRAGCTVPCAGHCPHLAIEDLRCSETKQRCAVKCKVHTWFHRLSIKKAKHFNNNYLSWLFVEIIFLIYCIYWIK